MLSVSYEIHIALVELFFDQAAHYCLNLIVAEVSHIGNLWNFLGQGFTGSIWITSSVNHLLINKMGQYYSPWTNSIKKL